jgi:hypothetical protein
VGTAFGSFDLAGVEAIARAGFETELTPKFLETGREVSHVTRNEKQSLAERQSLAEIAATTAAARGLIRGLRSRSHSGTNHGL